MTRIIAAGEALPSSMAASASITSQSDWNAVGSTATVRPSTVTSTMRPPLASASWKSFGVAAPISRACSAVLLVFLLVMSVPFGGWRSQNVW